MDDTNSQNTPVATGYDDQSLIAQLRLPRKSVRRQRAELCLQLPASCRWDVILAAGGGHLTGDPEALVEAIAERVRTHPRWRPVPCGARYLPCQFGTGAVWGVMDMRASERPGGIDWVTDEGGAPLRWDTFADAAAAADQLINNERNGQPVGIAQAPWGASVVRPGDRITGTCVTGGTSESGAVIRVVGPIRTPDCGGYRYLIRDDGGREHTVFAALLI